MTGEVEYRTCIVSFFDILGFSNLVTGSSQPNDPFRVLKEARYHANSPEDLRSQYEMAFFNFSDCVVRAIPRDSLANSGYRTGILFYELLGLVHVQLELAALAIPIRGAVTFGLLYYDDVHVFGPALVKAAQLEKDVAVGPRIVVDADVLAALEVDRRLGASHHTLKQDREYIYEMLTRDENGVWFIDYARYARFEVDGGAAGYVRFLQKHRTFVEAEASKAEEHGGRLVAKAMWLARYHNAIVLELDETVLEAHGSSQQQLVFDVEISGPTPETSDGVDT